MSVPQDAREPTEGGLNNHDVWFAREADTGVAPTDGTWERFSDRMKEIFGWQPEGNVEPDRGVSDVDVPEDGFYGGSEEHEASFLYRLQKSPLDSNGNIWGACFDALFRTEDGLVPNSHTVVDREWHPVGGNDGAGFYTWTVGLGGRPDVAESEGDAEEGDPLPFTLEYMFEKVRQFRVHQMSTSTTLAVASDDDADTDIQITAENVDASVSASATLDGTNVVALDADFDSLGQAELSTDAIGDVTVSINTGGVTDTNPPAAGTELMVIEGKDTASPPGSTAYEGDLGVPLLGAGTRETEVQAEGSRTYEHFIGDRIERAGGGAEIGPRINSASLSVENNHDPDADANSRRMMIDRGVHDTGLDASIAGPEATAKSTMDHLKTRGAEVTWYFDNFSLIFPNATITDVGEYAPEAEQVAMYIDNTFESSGIKLGDTDGNEVALPV